MRMYETTILVAPGPARADYEGTLATVRQAYEMEGAEWVEFEKWDERKLAYPIRNEVSALYIIGFFRAESAAIGRIERRVGLTDVILRHLIIARDGKSYDAIREQRVRAVELAAAAAIARERERED